MSMILSSLAQIDRVTESNLGMLIAYFKTFNDTLTKKSVTSLVRASWTFIQILEFDVALDIITKLEPKCFNKEEQDTFFNH